MIYFQSTNDYALAGPSAVTLGKFDGVHKGHRLLMDCIHRKEKEGCISTAFAIAAGRGPLLMTPAEQKKNDPGAGDTGTDPLSVSSGICKNEP